MQNKSLLTRFFVVTSLILSGLFILPTAFAAGGGGGNSYSSSPSKPYGYDKALKLVKAQKFSEAIPALLKISASAKEDADVQNLLGFSYRKTKQYNEAAKHYVRALNLDPEHKGALEYQGELFLTLKDRKGAEANLEKLKKICWHGCSELDDVEEALKNYQGCTMGRKNIAPW